MDTRGSHRAGEYEALPALYASWASELLVGPLPRESLATCDQCPMCAKLTDARHGQVRPFNPATKCCTYLPVLPNYLVGKVLLDDSPEGAPGRASVEARLASGIEVTPVGLGKGRVYDLLYRQGQGETFGRAEALRCPHYLETDGGQCGIWRNRNSVCATWFCKHLRGARGRAFWWAFRDLLGAVEWELSLWCVLELGVALKGDRTSGPNTKRSPLTPDEVDGRADQQQLRETWGRWSGREVEFYRTSSELVARLSWNDVVRICGPRVSTQWASVRDLYERMMADYMPERLETRPFQVVMKGDGMVDLSAYSEYDAVRVNCAVLNALSHFDGRPVGEILDSLASAEGPIVDRQLLLRLSDQGILSAATERNQR